MIPAWLTIIALISSIIATLLAPIIGLLAQSLIKKPTPTPEPNQPKARSKKIIAEWLFPRIIAPVAIVVCISLLLYSYYQTTTINRDVVLEMSGLVGCMICYVILILLFRVARALIKLRDRIRTLEAWKDAQSLPKEQVKPESEKSDSLLSVVKNL